MNKRFAVTLAALLAALSLAAGPVMAAPRGPNQTETPVVSREDAATGLQLSGGVNAGSVSAPEKLSLFGTVEFQDLEGGFYAVDGFALVGDTKLFAALTGKQVAVRGTRDTAPSILMVERIRVESISMEVSGARALPKLVTVPGGPVMFDQQPEVIDGVLMLPLRAVVQAAGGRVAWDPVEWAVTVEMPDRMAYFWVGQEKAEMNENNVRYFARNLIAMAKAPAIRNGRVMISADALTRILGLYEAPSTDGSLNLVFAR